MRIPLSTSEGLTILTMIIGTAVAWGTLSAKVNAQSEVLKTVPSTVTRIAVVETKIDYLTDLVEYSIGLRHARPSRPRLPNQ